MVPHFDKILDWVLLMEYVDTEKWVNLFNIFIPDIQRENGDLTGVSHRDGLQRASYPASETHFSVRKTREFHYQGRGNYHTPDSVVRHTEKSQVSAQIMKIAA